MYYIYTNNFKYTYVFLTVNSVLNFYYICERAVFSLIVRQNLIAIRNSPETLNFTGALHEVDRPVIIHAKRRAKLLQSNNYNFCNLRKSK